MQTITMKVADWIAVEDNPIQRDTERHAAKAKHLHTPLPTHYFVFAAQMPSGKLIKLDGHTRALMWKRKDIPVPTHVTVGVVDVRDRAHAEELYKTFDSRDALETMRDKVSGALNRFGFEPKSGLLLAGNLTFALRLSYSVLYGLKPTAGGSGASKQAKEGTPTRTVAKADVYAMISEFSYELHALDGLGLHQGSLPAGVVAAFILSYRKYGHKITPFWVSVVAKGGSKIGGQMDAIQALNELILIRRGKSAGGSAASDLCSRALRAVEYWLNDDLLYRVPTPLDTTDYLKGHEKPSERLIKKADIGKHS